MYSSKDDAPLENFLPIGGEDEEEGDPPEIRKECGPKEDTKVRIKPCSRRTAIECQIKYAFTFDNELATNIAALVSGMIVS